MPASGYIWWTFLNRQTFDTCENGRECTLCGKNLEPTKTINTAQSLPNLSGPNQELEPDFAGPVLDDTGNKTFFLVAIDRFWKFPSVLTAKTKGAKKVVKLLGSHICIHDISQSIRTDHGSGFKNDIVKQFCSSRGIDQILSRVRDHRDSGLVERSTQTITPKLGIAKFDTNFDNLKSTIQQIVEDTRKGKHAVHKKLPFELHFGEKPNLNWSQAGRSFVKKAISAQGLERNVLTPDQIASQDFSKDSAQVVPRGSASPRFTPRF